MIKKRRKKLKSESADGLNGTVNKRITSGAAVLAIGSVVAKMLGALYRVPLTNILGAEGMGMYQLVFPVYALFMVLATAGIPTALSRIVAEKRALGQPTKKYLASAMLVLCLVGTLCALLTFCLAKPLAKWQGNEDTYVGFMIIAPAIILTGIISGFRGWFQGQMYMLPTAVSNVLEQVVKLSLGIGLSVAFMPKGLIYGVSGAVLGVTASEAVTVVYMLVTYIVRGQKDEKEKLRVGADESRAMFKVAFPIAIVAILMPLSNFFDSIIVVNMLKIFGHSQSVATARYGILSGPVNSLVNMPIVAIMSLAVAIVPSVSMSRVRLDIDSVMLKSRLCVKLAYLLGIPFAFFFAVFAENIIRLIYPALSLENLTVAVNLLRIASANVVLLAVMQIYVSLLQALDKTKYAVLSLVCAICVKIVLSLVLVRFIGINGAAIAALSMSAVALFGVNVAYFKICGMHLEKNIGLNLLSGVIMALSAMVATLLKNDLLALVVGAIISAAAYVWTVFLFGLISKDDIPYLPLKRVLFALHRIIRFWEYKNET